MYFRIKNVDFDIVNSNLIFENKREALFDTYFNSFSIEKWKKYTVLDTLKLRLDLNGKFKISLINKNIIDNRVFESIDSVYLVESNGREMFEFEFPKSEKGMLCFKLEAMAEKSVFFGGGYYSQIDTQELLFINIAININICTFKGEAYIENNFKVLNERILQNNKSELFGHLKVYISDNGKSLDVNRLQDENIRIFPNKNVGGAGGFTRGLIEIIHDRENYNITHVIIMDDDVTIEPKAIVKTYNFLRLLKKEYKSITISGAMLQKDIKFRQYGVGNIGTWR